MAIEFVTDRYHWDPDGRRFLLDEPPALFDEPPDRVAVQAWRTREGWRLLYTHRVHRRP